MLILSWLFFHKWLGNGECMCVRAHICVWVCVCVCIHVCRGQGTTFRVYLRNSVYSVFQRRGLSLLTRKLRLVTEHQRSSGPRVLSIGITRACLMHWFSYVGSQGLVPPGKHFTPAQGTYLSSCKLTIFPSIEFFSHLIWIVAGASGLMWFLTFSPLLKFWRQPIV